MQNIKLIDTYEGLHEYKDHRFIVIAEIGNMPTHRFTGGIGLAVTTQFCETHLKSRPICVKAENTDGNAYIFGKTFDYKEYVYAGSHYNDFANTSVVDYTDLQEPVKTGWILDIDNFDYDTPEYNKLAKSKDSRILFMGETVGGDVGASVYVHLDANNDIDSIIIDVCDYIFN